MDSVRQIIKKSKTLLGPFPLFNTEKTPDRPYQLFLEWFQTAVDHGIHEPHAMTLSTVDEDGFPDARVLILKDADPKGWYFATSQESRKGRQLEFNNKVSLTFYWSKIGRQIRIRGKAIKMSEKASAKDFLNRSAAARAIALIGKQSSSADNQRDYEEAFQKQLAFIRKNPKFVSPSWILYRVLAEDVEFWQAAEDRRHIRLRYSIDREQWRKIRLWA